MSAAAALLLMEVLAGYLAIGLAVAVLFAWRGALGLAAHAATGTWGFRLAILPGAALLWPIVLRRWQLGARPAAMGDAAAVAFGDAAARHRRAIVLLVVGAPLALLLGVLRHRDRATLPALPAALVSDAERRP